MGFRAVRGEGETARWAFIVEFCDIRRPTATPWAGRSGPLARGGLWIGNGLQRLEGAVESRFVGPRCDSAYISPACASGWHYARLGGSLALPFLRKLTNGI